MKLDPCLISYTKVNSDWIKTVELLEENTEEKLNPGLGKGFGI